MDGIFIQDRFTMTDPVTKREFHDAIVLSQSEYNALTANQLTALKHQRFLAWLAVGTTPPPSPIPMVLSEQIQDTISQLSASTQTLQDLNTQASDQGQTGITMDQASTLSDVVDAVAAITTDVMGGV